MFAFNSFKDVEFLKYIYIYVLSCVLVLGYRKSVVHFVIKAPDLSLFRPNIMEIERK